MSKTEEYNPLDYDNLTKNCVEELMHRGPYPLEFEEPFAGAGVYALFYKGSLDFYAPIKSPNAEWPIYVGKAVPSGARKGAKTSGPSRSLFGRLLCLEYEARLGGDALDALLASEVTL